ncbi:hypothetical protein GIB67_010927 [Kingdonia uniflora]|uniref:Uncharacterized protein n=1 Tax=Kingdonia uniflora TaxID=39325 RepID=A0A7J7M4R1_9MAGN|nr:hypothetical protein GIB67_010927 [Kingdonia uniflora]
MADIFYVQEAGFVHSNSLLISEHFIFNTFKDKKGISSLPNKDGMRIEDIIEDMQTRIRNLERWRTINTVLWTFLMSALVGYSLYQRKRQ